MKSGFTLIELLVALSASGILLASAYAFYGGHLRAHHFTVGAYMQSHAALLYRLHSSQSGLRAVSLASGPSGLRAVSPASVGNLDGAYVRSNPKDSALYNSSSSVFARHYSALKNKQKDSAHKKRAHRLVRPD